MWWCDNYWGEHAAGGGDGRVLELCSGGTNVPRVDDLQGNYRRYWRLGNGCVLALCQAGSFSHLVKQKQLLLYCVLVSSSGNRNSAAGLWQLLLCDTTSTKSQPKGAPTKRVETENSKNVHRTRRKRSEAWWCIKSYAWERAECRRRRLPIYVRWLLVAQILRKHEIYTHLSGFIYAGIYRCWANIKRTYPNIDWNREERQHHTL